MSTQRASGGVAEGEGFEPPRACAHTGFQDRRLQPLGHPSGPISTRTCGRPRGRVYPIVLILVLRRSPILPGGQNPSVLRASRRRHRRWVGARCAYLSVMVSVECPRSSRSSARETPRMIACDAKSMPQRVERRVRDPARSRGCWAGPRGVRAPCGASSVHGSCRHLFCCSERSLRVAATSWVQDVIPPPRFVKSSYAAYHATAASRKGSPGSRRPFVLIRGGAIRESTVRISLNVILCAMPSLLGDYASTVLPDEVNELATYRL